jgi:DNA-binding phage protein
MALTRNFRETILARAQTDSKFRQGLLRGGIESMLSGNLDTGKANLRDYIKATIGFEQLGAEIGSSPKSLIRMFGPDGNPQARNLFAIVAHLQRRAQVTLHVTAQRAGKG